MEVTPLEGLSAQQVKRRMEQGLTNRVSDSASLSTGQIVKKNALTFFNLIFVVMAAKTIGCVLPILAKKVGLDPITSVQFHTPMKL